MSKQNILVTLTILLFIVVPIVLFVALSPKQVSSGKYDELAICLTEKGVKMYGAYWCSHCKAQKKMFGDSWSKVNYVECILPDDQGEAQECRDAKIEGYPTWEFGDGERLSGEVSLEVLAEKSGCMVNISQ